MQFLTLKKKDCTNHKATNGDLEHIESYIGGVKRLSIYKLLHLTDKGRHYDFALEDNKIKIVSG